MEYSPKFLWIYQKKRLSLLADSILKHRTFKKATQIQENKSNFHFSKYIFEKFLVSTHHFFQAALGGGLSFHLDLRFFFYVMIMMIDEKKLCDVVFFFNLCQVCNDGRYNFGNGIVGSQTLFYSQPILTLSTFAPFLYCKQISILFTDPNILSISIYLCTYTFLIKIWLVFR